MVIEEFILLRRIKRNRRRRLAHVNATHHGRLNLKQWSDSECRKMTHFTYQDIRRICNAAEINDKLKFNDFKISGELALAVTLTRLSFPERLCDMAEIFGISEGNISRVVNGMSKFLFNKFKRGIEFDKRQFSKENLERFSNALTEKGAIIMNVVGFIDGKMQQICRSKDSEIQKSVYNKGNHIKHIKFQAISTPDGITSTLCVPCYKEQNDPDVFDSSQMFERLSVHFDHVSPHKTYALYGDEAYSLSEHIIPAFSKDTKDGLEKRANASMSKLRAKVEIEFGRTVKLFSNPGNKTLHNNPALKYILETIFKNFHVCIYGSPISSMFKLEPPTLEEYISGLMREKSPNDILE